MKFLLLLLCPLISAGQSQKIGDVQFYALQDKGKPKETLRGNVTVYEDNVTNQGKQIKLYIEVVPAKISTKKSEPMFIIMGGPGQAATELVEFFSDIFSKINRKSDLVFIDQRGTGKSNPLRFLTNYRTLQSYFEDEFISTDKLRRSYQELAKDYNLGNYATLNAIIDIETIRRKLKYHKINLYGTSYGTRGAISYINKYPQHVRTATLKGVVPPDYVIPYPVAADAQRSMDLLIKDCKDNKPCNAAFPSLEDELNKFFHAQFPIKAEVTNPETQKKEIVELSKGIITLTFRTMLMSPSLTKNIPYLISQANKNNCEPLATTILAIRKSYVKGIYEGMTLCVICNEDYPLVDQTNMKADEQTFLQDYWMKRVLNACEVWNPEKKGTKNAKMKLQYVKTLIISGNRDAATPPQYGEQLRSLFPRSRHIIVNQGSHSFDGMRNCVEDIINDFVLSKNFKKLNTICVDAIKFPEYKLN